MLGGIKKKILAHSCASLITFPDTVSIPSWFGSPTPELSDSFCNTIVYTLGVQQI